MLVDGTRVARPAAKLKRRSAALLRIAGGKAVRRLGWGVADQAASSLTNFAVTVYVARTLGAAQFGAFSLAYLTYGFALNASRGLATDPLMVRHSGTDIATWRRAVRSCTGTAVVVGLVTGICAIAAGVVLDGTAGAGFLALGLTLPGLLLQDSWRYSFFALGRGGQALLNDLIWALALLPAVLTLRATGHASVFWFVFAWGASGAAAAVCGPLQARVLPHLSGARAWLSEHRDLGARYLAEGTASTASTQLRGYGIGLILGLAAVGYVQAASTLFGPIVILFTGTSLVAIPEGARFLRRSTRHLLRFSLFISGAVAAAALAWGVVLLIAVPRGLGGWLLPHIWRPTYPLLLPATLFVVALAVSGGPGIGLHALGASRRSLRAMLFMSACYVVAALLGAVEWGAAGAMWGSAVATYLGASMWWWQLRAALREHADEPGGARSRPRHRSGRHHKAAVSRGRHRSHHG